MAIIDNANDLMNMSEDELRERLLDPTYNKQNLRELVRRCVSNQQELVQLVEFYKEKVSEKEEQMNAIQKQASTFLEK